VSVRDDGGGFDPNGATAGFGLAGMRERVELLGGELSLTSAPGLGTTVSAALPLVKRQSQRAREASSARASEG
jgi:signal transduction histidine kinase